MTNTIHFRQPYVINNSGIILILNESKENYTPNIKDECFYIVLVYSEMLQNRKILTFDSMDNNNQSWTQKKDNDLLNHHEAMLEPGISKAREISQSIKSTGCSSRGLAFNSQQLRGDLQPFMRSGAFFWWVGIRVCMYIRKETMFIYSNRMRSLGLFFNLFFVTWIGYVQ